MDIDLLNQLSWLLGFTYEIVDMGYPPSGQTWTQHAVQLRVGPSPNGSD